MKSLRFVALALLLAACSDHGPTASTPVEVSAKPGKHAPAAVQAPAQVDPQPVTVTLIRLDGTSRSYQVPPELMDGDTPWPVLTVDGVRYDNDGEAPGVYRERTTQELADRDLRNRKARRGAFGP